MIAPLLIERYQTVNIFGREFGFGGICHPEKIRMISRHILNILFNGIKNCFFRITGFPEETGAIVMNLNPARRSGLELAGSFYQLLGRFIVKVALGIHPAYDTTAADGHIGLLVRY